MKHLTLKICLLFLALDFSCAVAQPKTPYQVPPKAIVDLINGPRLPEVTFSPDLQWMLLINYPTHFSIEKLAAPELKLAGVRVNPIYNGPGRLLLAQRISIKRASADSTVIPIKNMPKSPAISFISWSPDGKKLAFCHFAPKKIELWVIHVATTKAVKISELGLNAFFGGSPYQWMPDSQSLLCKIVPSDREKIPNRNLQTIQPIIQTNEGQKIATRTYSDMLKDANDEALFEYYATAQLVQVRLNGTQKRIIKKGIISGINISPNGRYLLLHQIHRPYSYLVNAFRFPAEVRVYDLQQHTSIKINNLPLREQIPMGKDGVQKEPRGHEWRPDVPATLYWVQAQDQGDPQTKAPFRDKIYTLEAPFTGQPQEFCQVGLRFDKIVWGNDTTAILVEKWWEQRKVIWTYLNPKQKQIVDTLFVFSSENRFTQPGEPALRLTPTGQSLLSVQRNGSIFLLGQGASPEGGRPFIDQFDFTTQTKKRIWQSSTDCYEMGRGIIDAEKPIVLTRRESKYENPNYYVRDLSREVTTQISFIPNPLHSLGKIKRQELHYRRADSTTLTADLYLPNNYHPQQGPLPTFLWAYPVEYKQKAAAGQALSSSNTFIGFNSFAAFFATQGYAVLDNVAFPIVSKNNKEPNDTFLEQLIDNAKAAIQEGVRQGVVDSSRVAIGGHSYGAFMVANLVTHTKLFKSGIALSGAYNRTLTPFGFQREYRNYWQVPELYNRLSPFQQADRMKVPLLLIHGDADDNAGTHTIQSERYFNALKGLGATVRYVRLPYEGHNYYATESVLHIYWEVGQWLDNNLKNSVKEALTTK